MKNTLQELGELGLGSRFNRLSDYLMKETQTVYNILIQEQLQYTQPAITQALKKLVHKGLIKFKTDTIDKRKKLFRLSPKGKKTHMRLIPVWDTIDKQVKWLTEGSSTSLVRHLTHMENQFKEKSLSQRILENLKQPS